MSQDKTENFDHEGFVLPRTDTEKMIAEIWCNVLGLNKVSIHDSFFDLGGHSLSAMLVSSRLLRMLGIKISVRTLFENDTLVGFAQSIDRILQSK
jgi:hypothetical protein